MPQVLSHSFLINPSADWTNKDRPECRIGAPDDIPGLQPMNCPGPCGTGNVEANGGVFFNPSAPSTLFRRGETVFMKWTRNNHQSGFVRFTLVPKQDRMDNAMHDKFSFHYACWEAGKTNCAQQEFCGTDQERIRFQTPVEIPRVFPDGEYVLGWSWYGGTRFRDGGPKAEYGDYYSCANIVIEGSVDENGQPNSDGPIEQYTPVFIPGLESGMSTCFASVSQLGICASEPCYARYPGEERVPAQFAKGSPPAIQRQDIQERLPNTLNDGRGNEEASKNNVEQQNLSVPENSRETSIDSLEFVDVDSMEVLSELHEGSLNNILVGDRHRRVTIKASTSGVIQQIIFFANGAQIHTETESPFYCAGDINGNPRPWLNVPMDQEFTFSVRAIGVSNEDVDTVSILLRAK